MARGRASSPVGRAAFKAVGALDRCPVGSTPTSSANSLQTQNVTHRRHWAASSATTLENEPNAAQQLPIPSKRADGLAKMRAGNKHDRTDGPGTESTLGKLPSGMRSGVSPVPSSGRCQPASRQTTSGSHDLGNANSARTGLGLVKPGSSFRSARPRPSPCARSRGHGGAASVPTPSRIARSDSRRRSGP